MVRTRHVALGALVSIWLAGGLAQAAPGSAAAADEIGDSEAAGAPSEGADLAPTEDAAEDSGAALERAQRLFREGEEAYWLGDFGRAIERFEAAYRLSKVPGMLYNVGLAYKRRFETSRAPADLQRARAVFANYLDADARLLVDPSHVEALIAEIDAALEAEAEAAGGREAGRSADAQESAIDELAACPDVPVVADGSRRRRIVGAVTMGISGVLLSGGAASVAAFAAKGREFEATQARLVGEQAAAGCPSSSQLCADLDRSLEITVGNGYRANVLAGAVGGSLLALGVGGLVTGAIVYARASGPRGERPPRAQIGLTPTFGGAALVGRF